MNFAIDSMPAPNNPLGIDSQPLSQSQTGSTAVSTAGASSAPSRTYVVQPGDSVRSVCQKVGQPFDLVRSLNAHAVRQASDGRWYFIAGARIEVPASFQSALTAAEQNQAATVPVPAEAGPPPFTPEFHVESGSVRPRDHSPSSLIQELGNVRSPMSPDMELALGLTRSVRPVQETPSAPPNQEQPNLMLKFILNF